MCSLRWWHSNGALLLHNSLLLSRHLQWIIPPMNGPFSLFSHRLGPRRWILIQRFTLHMALMAAPYFIQKNRTLGVIWGTLSFFLSFLRSDKSDYKWQLALISQCYFLMYKHKSTVYLRIRNTIDATFWGLRLFPLTFQPLPASL